MSILIQGSDEWLQMRKSKIGASDASAILGISPWKSALKLWEEKLSMTTQTFKSSSMQRGIDLEPMARELFTAKTGIEINADVRFSNKYEWMMASLDGIDVKNSHIVEIKCPNSKDHSIAVSGKIPDHYYPQLQHQMAVCEVDEMFYFSFDGFDGVIVKVKRDDEYIENLIQKEQEFYECMINRTPPKSSEINYQERHDDEWMKYASKWKSLNESIKQLDKEEKIVREKLIELSGESSSRGQGISLCRVERKGTIDYSAIPQLKNVDLEKYRKPSSLQWRIL